MTRSTFTFLIVTLCASWTAQPASADDRPEYEIAPRGSEVRWHFWASDGVADVIDSGSSVGNRFRLGAEAQFGQDYRFIFGSTLFDTLSSGETSSDVGDISRNGWDFNFGYFLVPDKLWLEYSFQLGTVHGNEIGGHIGTTGHGFNLGYKLYEQENLNIAIEAGYMYVFSETANTFNFINQTFGTATYPQASVWSLSLVFGLDLGGRGEN